MTCVACREMSVEPLCPACVRSLVPAPERYVGRLLVRSAFRHEGAARRLVHRLKYEAVWGVAERLAEVMRPLLPEDATVLVPVPRVAVRRHRYGVDPAAALARALGRTTGLAVSAALRPPVWVHRRAGRQGSSRGTPSYARRAHVVAGAVLVDDVVTSGTTLRAAAVHIGSRHAVTATAGHWSLTAGSGPP